MGLSPTTLPGVIAEAMRTQLASLTEGQALKRTTTGFLDAVRDPAVNGGGGIRIDRGNGKTRTQKVQYMPKAEKTILSSRPADCEYTEQDGYETDTVELSLYTGTGFLVDEVYVQQIEEGGAEYIRDSLMRLFDDLARDVNSKAQTAAATGFGVNQATGLTTVRTIDILNASADNATLVSGWYDFKNADLMQSNYAEGPFVVVAQGNFDRFVTNQQWACCNDSGFDLARLGANGINYFRDQQVEDTLGANQAFVWEPGAVQWLTFHKYAHQRGAASVFQDGTAYGAYQEAGGNAKGVIMDPRSGLVYDFIVKQDACGDKYQIGLEMCFDVWTAPTDQVYSGDKLDGTNGLFRYQFDAV